MMKMRKNNRKKVGLIVDNPSRDLPGLVLVSYELTQRGIDCFLIPMNLKDVEVWLLELEFIILNYVRTSNSDFVKKLIKSKIPYGVIDTEGLVAMDWETFFSYIGERKNSLNSSLYCSWGEIQASKLIDNQYYEKKSVAITGTPRFDFYYEDYLKNENQKLPIFLKKSKYILINTAYTFYNPKFKSREKEKKWYMKDFGWSEEFCIWLENQQKIALNSIVKLTKKISILHPETNFIIRPHPFENLNIYKNSFKDYNNIHAIHDGTVHKWLSGAIALIHQNCTTSFESGLLRIPALFPTYFGQICDLEPINNSSILCEKEEQIIEIIDDIIKGKFKFSKDFLENLEKKQKKWHYLIDGKSHFRIANNIEQALKEIDYFSMNNKQIRKYVYNIGFKSGQDSYKIKLTNYIRYLTKIPFGHSFFKRIDEDYAINKWKNSAKMYDVKTVKNIINEIHKVKKGTLPSVTNISNDYTGIYKQESLMSLKVYC